MQNIVFDKLYQQLNTFEKNHITVDTAANGKRHYSVNGSIYPSVTTVLGAAPKPKLEEWKAKVGEGEAKRISRAATERGTRIHALTENYILGQPRVYENAEEKEMFLQIKTTLDRHLTRVYLMENVVWSKFLNMAGRIDLCGGWDQDGEPSVIDLKTSKGEKKIEWIRDYFLQTTAYAMMIQYVTRGRLKPKMCRILMATENSSKIQFFEDERSKYEEELLDRIADYRKENEHATHLHLAAAGV